MKNRITYIAVIVTAFLTASCQKENNSGGVTSSQVAPEFTASTEGCDNTRTTVENVDKTYKTYWENGDLIKINGATYSATPDETDARKATFTYQSGETPSGTYKAYFPESMFDGSTATLPATYTYTEGKYDMPMYAESTTKRLSFKNLCGVLAITVPSTQMTSVTSIIVTSDKRMNGAFTATEEGVLTFTSSDELKGADKKVTLTFNEAKTIAAGSSVTVYIPVPAGTHNLLSIYVLNGTSTTKAMVTKKSESVTISRNTVYPITFVENHSFFLSGKFTVSSSGKKVRFSQGNLYYDGTDFNFETNQYESQPTTASTTYVPTHVSHFRWAKNSGSLSDDIASAISTDITDPAGTASDNFFTNASRTDARTDFTVQFQTGIWRILSGDEWNYMLTTRGGYAKANVNSTKGLIIFPDGYSGTTSGEGIACLNSASVDFPNTSIPVETWASMESDGCVFLPAAGHREGSKMSEEVGTRGVYWTNAPLRATDLNAYNLRFQYNNVLPYNGGQSRYRGYSVRLVFDVE